MIVSFFFISTPTLAHMIGKNRRPNNERILVYLAGHCQNLCMKSSDFCPFTVSLGVVSERILGACPATRSSSGQVNEPYYAVVGTGGGR